MTKIQEIAEFNQKQFDNIHKTMQKYDSNLAYNQDKLHNIVGVLRANTYIHKDWIKKTKQCSFFDYIARLIQLDFICTPFPTWWAMIKEAAWIVMIILIACVGINIALLFLRCHNGKKRTL